MNERIKELVEQAKFETTIGTHVIKGPTQIFFGDEEVIQKFAALVAEAERKAEREEILGFCERMCEAHRIVGYVVSPILKEVMKYIRERGSK